MKDLSLVVYLALFISAMISLVNLFLEEQETVYNLNTVQVMLGFVILLFIVIKSKNTSGKLRLAYGSGFALYFLANLYKLFDGYTLTSKSFEFLQIIGIYLIFTLANKTQGFVPLGSYVPMLKNVNFLGDNVVRNLFQLGVKK